MPYGGQMIKKMKTDFHAPFFPLCPSPDSPSFHHLAAFLPSTRPPPPTTTTEAATLAIAQLNHGPSVMYWPHRKPFSRSLCIPPHCLWRKARQSKIWLTNLGSGPSAWTSNLMVPWFQCLSASTLSGTLPVCCSFARLSSHKHTECFPRRRSINNFSSFVELLFPSAGTERHHWHANKIQRHLRKWGAHTCRNH